MIYKIVFCKWRSIRPVEINQYEITMSTHYDITMGNNVAKDVHCEITIGNDIAKDIYCNVTMTREISLHKHNSCVLPRLIKHSLVLVTNHDCNYPSDS